MVLSAVAWFVSCKHSREALEAVEEPAVDRLGTRGDGPSYDKSQDTTLQRLIRQVAPRFTQHTFHDLISGDSLEYNLYVPRGVSADETYPLVLFMADASTPGRGVKAPLLQGLGALVWAAPEWQREHPCAVLVPQFSGRAVNDEFEHSTEVDAVMRLLDDVANELPVDRNRIYTTGQSMGGMISMYLCITYPEVFAAAMPVDCHWDSSEFGELVRHPMVYITAGGNPKSQGGARAVQNHAAAQGIACDTVSINARIPLADQDSICRHLLAKGAPINIITFRTGTVLPAGETEGEHMHSFDAAYRLLPPREWLFRQHR